MGGEEGGGGQKRRRVGGEGGGSGEEGVLESLVEGDALEGLVVEHLVDEVKEVLVAGRPHVSLWCGCCCGCVWRGVVL